MLEQERVRMQEQMQEQEQEQEQEEQEQMRMQTRTLPPKPYTRVCCVISGRRRTTRSTGNVSRQSWRCPGA
jgi:hypothetical protein